MVPNILLLTLMKSDEVVETREERANLTLFKRGRIAEIHVGDVLVVDVDH